MLFPQNLMLQSLRWMAFVVGMSSLFTGLPIAQAEPPDVSYTRGEWKVPAKVCLEKFTGALRQLRFEKIEKLDETSVQGIRGDYITMAVCDSVATDAVNYAIIVAGPQAEQAEKIAEEVTQASE